jgi:hypothetical protein
MTRRLRSALFLTVLISAVALVGVVPTTPALADTIEKCNNDVYLNWVCIYRYSTPTGNMVKGHIYGSWTDLTQYVKQCDGLGHNCSVITASHQTPTSPKPTAFGHVYQNCASWTSLNGIRHTNICSPFVVA